MNDYCPGAVQRPQPGGVTLDRSLPPRVVWHITWDQLRPDGSQPDFSAVAGYLIGKQYCPHIMWNPFTGYIEQYYPASVGGRALTYNNQDGAACVQVEVFFTPGCVVDGVRYATVADTPLKGLDTLLAWADSLGIPRTWPMGAPQWQNNKRDVGIWNTQPGHYGHCHSPGDTHTDPGPMPDLNRGGITLQAESITTLEDDVSAEEVLSWPIERTDGQKSTVAVELAKIGPDLGKLDGIEAKLDKILENTTESMLNDRKQVYSLEAIQSAPPAQIAADINAAGIASAVRDELVKLLEGKSNG